MAMLHEFLGSERHTGITTRETTHETRNVGIRCGCWALLVHGARRRRGAGRDDVVIGDIDDLSGVYADVIGAGGVEAIKMAIADFGGKVLGKKIVAADRRPPEQARHRRLQVPRVGRPERPQHAARRLEHGRQHRHGEGRGGEEDAVLHHRRGRRLAHQRGLHRLHRALRLRHDRARQRHRHAPSSRTAARPGSS